MAVAEYEQFLTKLKQLRLSRMAELLDAALKEAASSNMTYLDFLRRLVDEEFRARQERTVAARVVKSRMPAVKTLESFDFSYQPSLNPRKVWELAELRFIERHENLVILGPPGVGKSHISLALGFRACQAGYKVLFTTLTDMAAQLRASHADSTLLNALRAYTAPELLIIDEVGYLPVEEQVANYLFQVVARRYEQASIILTSNKSFTEWGEMLGDTVLAGAILDRLLHHATVLTINGPSYRMKDKLQMLGPKEGQP